MKKKKTKKSSVKRRRDRADAAPAPPASMARLPLPAKGEKRHGDRTKYARAREKERLRKEIDR